MGKCRTKKSDAVLCSTRNSFCCTWKPCNVLKRHAISRVVATASHAKLPFAVVSARANCPSLKQSKAVAPTARKSLHVQPRQSGAVCGRSSVCLVSKTKLPVEVVPPRSHCPRAEQSNAVMVTTRNGPHTHSTHPRVPSYSSKPARRSNSCRTLVAKPKLAPRVFAPHKKLSACKQCNAERAPARNVQHAQS